MADGVLYKSSASGWSKTVCKKSSASGWTDGKVQHSNGSNWFDNYPMEQLYESYFNVQWTQGYNGAGVKLDAGTWGDHPKSGDSIDFKGVWGFDRAAMQSFVGNGVIQQIKLEIKLQDPGHQGNPDVWFAPHTYTSKPAPWNEANVFTEHQVKSTFVQTGGAITRWITFPPAAWMGGNLAGFRADGAAEASDSATFAGKTTSHGITAFNSRIYIQVLK